MNLPDSTPQLHAAAIPGIKLSHLICTEVSKHVQIANRCATWRIFNGAESFVTESESESYITTDCQSANLSWNKAPIWGLRPDFYYCQTIAGLLMWGALSDERMALSFTIAAGSRQYSHFRVRDPWDSWPYFTVSDSRLLLSLPPTTRKATVEVFDPASTRDTPMAESVGVRVTLRLAVNWQSVRLGAKPLEAHGQILF
jgi:hypothetical protein